MEKKPSNFQVAMYVANKYGGEVPLEKLEKIAEMYNFKKKVFINNYKDIVKMNNIFKD